MDALVIDGMRYFPKVILDKNKNTFTFTGISRPEDVDVLYTPIINWLKVYASDPNPKTLIEFNFSYLNSASMKKIYIILSILEGLYVRKLDVKVKWFYELNDDTMKERAEDILSLLKIPFEIISV